jgi:hypothetical protein
MITMIYTESVVAADHHHDTPVALKSLGFLDTSEF